MLVKNILEILKQYSLHGEEKLVDGTYLICRTPHIAPQAWLHLIFRPLCVKEIDQLEIELKSKIPLDYVNFLLKMNGLSMYSETLELYGMRKNRKRNVESSRQPYSIVMINKKERNYYAGENCFYFGSYNWDGSVLYIDIFTRKVYRCNRDDGKVLNKWKNFEQFLLLEVNRIDNLFDMNGVEIDEDFPSVPPSIMDNLL